jgi:HlyD family secretion protein
MLKNVSIIRVFLGLLFMELPLFAKVKRPATWSIGIVAGSLILLGGVAQTIVRQQSSQIDVEALTVPVESQTLKVEIVASGRIEPIKSVNVSPKNPSRLVKLLVEQGDVVRKGQILAVMENAEIKAQTNQAAAEAKRTAASFQENRTKIAKEIDRAQARLTQVQSALSQAEARIPRDIDRVNAQITAARSRLKLVEERKGRNQYLLEQGAITQDTFDEASNEYDNALSSLQELEQQLKQLQTTGGSEISGLKAEVAEAQIDLKQKQQTFQDELAGLESAVASSQAALEQRQIQYDDTIVTAPFDGTVTQRYAVEGAYVTPSTSASSTASASATSILALAQGLEIVAQVPEIDIGQLSRGQKVEIVADAYPDTKFYGEVKRIAPEAIEENGVTSFEVRVSLLTGQDKLRSKMNVDVTFLGQELDNAMVVPTVAIVTQQGQTGVMILNEDNKPQFQPVEIGLTIEDKTQILQGLESNRRVFIDLPPEKEKGDKE